jgi:hypothetical protein
MAQVRGYERTEIAKPLRKRRALDTLLWAERAKANHKLAAAGATRLQH